MAERGCYVSPQQCEDKFNDLNKRYKRLTDILGRGTSCKVVENPALLDRLNLSEKMKDDVRKILSSKHLFYEEMCSYHLEEKKLHIQAQMLELKKQRYKWQRFSKKKDRELNMMRMENERMKLENECLSLELRQKEMELDLTSKKTQLCKII
ncbi:hypothetical protein MUK42_36376 [Musa troglodytarum]|uniref:Myb/SANT-like DNA-binding domain-containing protein n=1 Tax=Musa troglodytarum TaxID=320322 RepID=A0A9E7HG71_9LILI|nr:hypothetical protein MUK42_36376 [Musa troglodytarum]